MIAISNPHYRLENWLLGFALRATVHRLIVSLILYEAFTEICHTQNTRWRCVLQITSLLAAGHYTSPEDPVAPNLFPSPGLNLLPLRSVCVSESFLVWH